MSGRSKDHGRARSEASFPTTILEWEGIMAKILLVDDEEDIRATFRNFLTDAGHEVVEASDGLEGLNLYHALAPDLVITDIVMPGKEGWTLIREIRNAHPQAKIVAISGQVNLGKAPKLGVFSGIRRLQKPINMASLLSVTGELLESD